MQPLIVDAHYDLLADVYRLRMNNERKVIERFYLEDLKEAGINVLICSLFIADPYVPEMALKKALEQISALHYEMEESPGFFELCRNAKEIKKTTDAGKIALLLSFEGAEPIGDSLLLLRPFYELGVRFLGLVWSRRNYAAEGCHFNPTREGTVGGVSAFGVQLIEEAEKLGMILDVSHLNDVGFADVAKLTQRPFIASHSNMRSLCGVPRNLTDEQIKLIASRGGVMGLNNMLNFIFDEKSRKNAYKDMSDKDRYSGLLKHAQYAVDLVGPEHLGLGLDLCEFDKPEDKRDLSAFRNYRQVKPFIAAIRDTFPKETADKILGGNWMRIIKLLK